MHNACKPSAEYRAHRKPLSKGQLLSPAGTTAGSPGSSFNVLVPESQSSRYRAGQKVKLKNFPSPTFSCSVASLCTKGNTLTYLVRGWPSRPRPRLAVQPAENAELVKHTGFPLQDDLHDIWVNQFRDNDSHRSTVRVQSQGMGVPN